ncbi:MAG: hypothetical protein AAFW76_08215 [Pseudomonadota bacterium]
MFRTWQPGMPPDRLNADLFEGALIIVRDLAPLSDMVHRARTIVETVFDTDEPVSAEARLTPEQFTNAAKSARRQVDNDHAIHQSWIQVLEAIGFRPQAVFGDRMRLRIVPSRAQARSTSAMPLAAHRDSWGAGIMAQVNWWLPLYPIGPSRTMLVWPELFRAPVANTSKTWDLAEAIAARKSGRTDVPLLPVTTAAPEADDAVPVDIEPGEMLAFSAAHLHGSVTDESGLTRLGLDTRTLWQDDLVHGRGAPNVDGQTQQLQWGWFKRLSDGKSATDTLI